MRVLLIDDDPDDRRLAARILGRELDSAEIVQIGQKSELEAALRIPEAPALAVTDYALNWSDGLEVFQRIRAAYPQCPVIAFTGVGDEALAVELTKAGVDDYVIKSDRDQLGAAARTAIERAAARQENEQVEVRYRELFRSVPVGMYQCTRSGELVAGNPALVALLGLSSEDDLRGANLKSHIEPQDAFPPEEAGDKPWTSEVRLNRADGGTIQAIHTIQPIRMGADVGYVGALTDVSPLAGGSSE